MTRRGRPRAGRIHSNWSAFNFPVGDGTYLLMLHWWSPDGPFGGAASANIYVQGCH